MNECMLCSSDITTIESQECQDHCYTCHQNLLISSLARELREARITFEEMIRKIMAEVDK